MGKINVGRLILGGIVAGSLQIFWITWWITCGWGRSGPRK